MASAVNRRVGEGDILAQRYHVQEVIGEGTRAYVVRARDALTEEIVSCKIPLDESEAHVQALRRQHRLFRHLKSRNLQALLTLERHREAEREFDFLVFEFVEGKSLEDWHAGKPLRQRLEVLATIAETLAALAAEGAVHGDLGPSNVLVDPNGRVVLIDPEADESGSAVPRITSTARRVDLGGLSWIAETLLPAGRDRDVLRGLFDRLSLSDIPSLSAKEVAGAVRHALSLPFLPGESDSLGTLATAYTNKVDDDRATFAKIVDLRDLAFRNVCDLLRRTMAPLEIHVEENLETSVKPAISTLVLQGEIKSNELGRGRLHHRSIACTSTHGDQLCIFFNSQSEIRKPWPFPDRPGLIARGMLTVARDGKLVLNHSLEMWLRGETPLIFVVEPARYRSLDATIIERATLVLIEQLFPGIESPVTLEKGKRPWLSLRVNFMETVQRWCKGRKIQEPKSEIAWLKVFLELAFSMDIIFPSPASKAPLRGFFEIPRDYSARLKLVQEAAAVFRQAYGQEFNPLYSVDVSVADELEGRLRVDFDSERLKHSFEVDAATTATIVARVRKNPQVGQTVAKSGTNRKGRPAPRKSRQSK